MLEMVWSVEKFLSQYTAENTKRNYKSTLMHFFSLIYPELSEIKEKNTKTQRLNELSIQYFSEERDMRDDIIQYRNSQIKYAPKTRISRLAAIFRYFEDNGHSFPRNFIRNINGKSSDPITKERVPNAEELKRIFEYLPIHSKCLAIVLASSGMRIGEALQLGVDGIDLKSNPVRITIPYHITKTQKKRITFISTEAKEIVEEWLLFRPEFIRRANRRGLYMRKELTAENDPRLFPFSIQTFLGHWKSALTKTNLLEIDNRRMTIRSHNLRKFFRTHGKWTRPEIAEALMGHQAGLNAVYARYDQAEEILMEEYLKVEPSLSISTHSTTLIKLQEKVDSQSEDIQKLVTNLSVENVHMKERVQELEKLYEMSVEDRTKLSLQVEDLALKVEYLVKDLPAVMKAPEADA